MRKIFMLMAAVVAAILPVYAREEFHPVAKSEAQVIVGNARFTMLTTRLVRMEWSEDGKFEDRATLGVVNRDLPLPQFKARRIGHGVVITTPDMVLTYKGGKFDQDNLNVQFKLNGQKAVWRPGMSTEGNLLGTARTLDRFDGVKTSDPYDLGVVSRDGWAVIDESDRHVYVPVEQDWKYWVEARDGIDRQDWYLFVYGHEYTSAVTDFTRISGNIPLPPKYAFGYWWCRYWQYSDFEFRDLAQHFRDLSIPADVMIIDMDWHETWGLTKKGKKDEVGQRIGWTGYTWKKELFPDPENFLSDLHDFGLKTSLNLHPASGIQPYEEPYARFVKDYTSRTSDYDGPKGFRNGQEKVAVPFRIDQMEWADAYMNSVLHPLEKQGVDFWWLDWQQWKESKYMDGLSNTFWLNYVFFNDKARQSESMGSSAPRPMIYHRWGGIGSHRYQVGFSGDTYATWKVLGALPAFTATASNVGYGYWGHDIGGHLQPKGVAFTDPELYTRWIQGGVFTPIFKTHSTKDRSMEKRFWVFPDHFDYMREAVRLRYDLSPYIYGAARQCYDTGIAMCRPLYYYYPENEEAYSCNEEFFFGSDILATVVCNPADQLTGLAPRSMWFPQCDDWFDMSTGTIYKGGSNAELHYTIAENPWFVRAGAIIPMAGPDIMSLQQPSDELRFLIAPGIGSSSTVLYEDDGCSQQYESRFATTSVEKNTSAEGVRVRVAARQGDYEGAPSERRVRIVLPGATAPYRVTVNGTDVPYSRFARKDAAEGKMVWGYDGTEMAVTVYVDSRSVSEELLVECDSRYDFVNGEKGLLKRMQAITPEVKLIFSQYVDPYLMLPDSFLGYAGCASYILENPWGASEYLKALNPDNLRKELESFKAIPSDFVTKIMAQVNR